MMKAVRPGLKGSAEITAVDGNRVSFRVEAHDETDLIGQGIHTRVVVDVARFDARVAKKGKRQG